MSYVGMFVDALFFTLDLQLIDAPNLTARWTSRVAVFVTFGVIGFMAYQRSFCSTRTRTWVLTAMEILLSALLVVRNYYEPNNATYRQNAGIWSIGLKSGLACFEVGYLRMLLFLVSETTFQSVAHYLRPAWNGYPLRWFLCVFVWFAAHSYYVEHKSRQSFAQKCEFRLAHALAEEAHRLHRLLTDHTLEMICVHEFGGVAEAEGAIVARIKYVSNSCQQLTGWSAVELVNKSPLDFVHVDDIDACRKFFQSWSQSGDAEDLVSACFLQASSAANGVAAPSVSESASTNSSASADIVLSMGFDELSKLERDPSSIELVPLVSQELTTDTSAVNVTSGIVHRVAHTVPRTAKVRPISLGASTLKMASEATHSDSTSRPGAINLTRWKPASLEDHVAPGDSSSSHTSSDLHISSEDISASSYAARTERLLRLPDTAGLDDIHPVSYPAAVPDAVPSNVVPGASAARFAYGGINLRFKHKTGEYITLDVTKSSTPEGIVCVYRDASWKTSPRLAVA
jgi:PAS domain-containing protein